MEEVPLVFKIGKWKKWKYQEFREGEEGETCWKSVFGQLGKKPKDDWRTPFATETV